MLINVITICNMCLRTYKNKNTLFNYGSLICKSKVNICMSEVMLASYYKYTWYIVVFTILTLVIQMSVY